MTATAVVDRMRVVVAPGPLVQPALSRVLGIAASRACLPVGRIEDALGIAELIAAHAATELAGDRLALDLAVAPGSVTIALGPLREGGGARLSARDGLPGVDGSIALIAASAAARPGDAGEQLVIAITAAERTSLGPAVPAGDGFSAQVGPVDGAIGTVVVRGELDISTVPELKRAAQESLAGDAGSLVLDLSATTFIDSTGLGAILGLARQVRPDGDVAVVNVDPAIAQTFQITGLDMILRICSTRDEALRALASQRQA